MGTSKVIYLGELRTEAQHLHSGVKIITDAPLDNQGKAEYFSPTDLAATSLATCGMTIMGIAARTHGFSIEGTEASVTKIMLSNPRRIGEVQIDYNFPEIEYTEKQKKIIEIAGTTCPVALSLHPDLVQTIRFNFWK
jgi:putative redox protein